MHVINFRQQQPPSKVKAYFDIDFGYVYLTPSINTKVIFKNWYVMPTKSGGYFISGPRFRPSSDRPEYEDYIKIEGDIKKFFDELKELITPMIT